VSTALAVTVQDIYMIQQEVYAEICEVYPQDLQLLKIFLLVVWNMAFMTFHILGKIIIPTDELIFFRGVGQPPTSIAFLSSCR
jgi:hypothetical protein